MTEYNEGARGRARYWMERAMELQEDYRQRQRDLDRQLVETENQRDRAQRAEAECERLRDALRQLSFAAQTTGGTAGRDEGLVAAIGMAETALATPPPEKPEAPTIDELHEERKRWRRDAPHTPEQPEGEKLDSDMQEVLDRSRRRNYLSGEAKQAHGDALDD